MPVFVTFLGGFSLVWFGVLFFLRLENFVSGFLTAAHPPHRRRRRRFDDVTWPAAGQSNRERADLKKKRAPR